MFVGRKTAKCFTKLKLETTSILAFIYSLNFPVADYVWGKSENLAYKKSFDCNFSKPENKSFERIKWV